MASKLYVPKNISGNDDGVLRVQESPATIKAAIEGAKISGREYITVTRERDAFGEAGQVTLKASIVQAYE